jgi:hypothetical protein
MMTTLAGTPQDVFRCPSDPVRQGVEGEKAVERFQSAGLREIEQFARLRRHGRVVSEEASTYERGLDLEPDIRESPVCKFEIGQERVRCCDAVAALTVFLEDDRLHVGRRLVGFMAGTALE